MPCQRGYESGHTERSTRLTRVPRAREAISPIASFADEPVRADGLDFRRSGEDDRAMERRWRAGSTGYVVVLLGAVAFVVGLFLPYYDYDVSPFSLSLYRVMLIYPEGAVASVGAFLF